MSATELRDSARLFVGVALGDTARERVAELFTRTRALVAGPGWGARVPADDDMHVTLRFLAAVPRSRIPALESALADALGGALDGHVSYGPIEVLPEGDGTPKHAWLRVGEGAPFLAALAALVERACIAAGVADEGEREHDFRPHVTIVRVDRAPEDAREALLGLETGVLCSERVAEVTVFESTPRVRPGAAHYAPLARFPLRAQAVDALGAAR